MHDATLTSWKLYFVIYKTISVFKVDALTIMHLNFPFQCLNVSGKDWTQLDSLDPYSDYSATVRVRPRSGGFWSDSQQINFSTNAARKYFTLQLHFNATGICR